MKAASSVISMAREWCFAKPPRPAVGFKFDFVFPKKSDWCVINQQTAGLKLVLSNIDDVSIQSATTGDFVGETRQLNSSDDTRRIIDIDADMEDPFSCPDNADEQLQNLRLAEMKRRPRTDYMEKLQKNINPRARARCVDWLVDAAERHSYTRETLHLTINCLDRYLSGNAIDCENFRFIGLTCMMIASKYEEVVPLQLDIDACSDLSMSAFSREDFIRMERSILSHLKYELTIPTTWSFLEMFVRVAQGGKEAAPLQSLESMASYIAELSLLSYGMLRFLPSLVAASSVFLARSVLDPSRRPWNDTLQHYTKYRPSDLRDCVLALRLICHKSSSSKMVTIRMKYSQQRYEYVALKGFPPSIPPEIFQNLSC